MNLHEEQIQREQNGIQQGLENYRKQLALARQDETGLRGESTLPPGVKLCSQWLPALTEAIEKARAVALSGRAMIGVKIWAPSLSLLPPEHMAAAALQTALNCCVRTDVTNVVATLGSQIELEVNWATLREGRQKWIAEQHKDMAARGWSFKSIKKVLYREKANQKWETSTRIHVGAFLLNLLCDYTDAFEIVTVPYKKHVQRRVQLTKSAMDYLETEHRALGYAKPVLPMMLVPPVPWSGPEEGGFLFLKKPLVKGHYFRSHSLVDMDGEHLQALNIIQETEWVINKTVLDTMLQVWKAGGGVGLPVRKEPPKNPKPHDWATNPEAKKKWKKTRTEALTKWFKNTSRRAVIALMIDSAEDLGDSPFWCPWNFDWRGRMYPLAGHLSPHSSEETRALFLFKKKKPLGAIGWKWLRIHAANTFGEDKCSFDDRVKWVERHLNDIIDSATDPLDGSRFWQQADDPWMFLAACIEINNAFSSGDPDSYLCGLPGSIDGTCNGLQHYAAIGRDPVAARLVNLEPGEVPADLYTSVLQEVLRRCEADSLDADSQYCEVAAWWLESGGKQGLGLRKGGRKIVKRGAMTYSYGVTPFGVKDQLLMDGHTAGYIKPRLAADYLGRIISAAIPTVVDSAAKYMAWFQQVAQIINETDQALPWSTPTGFRPVQVYVKQRRKHVMTILGQVYLQEPTQTRKLDTKKQVSAVAPNVIHSFDASHMARVVCEARRQGVTDFLMVHDSYGCHMGDIERLGQITREKFVEMYQDNLLEDFKDEVELATGVMLPDLPARGDFDINRVLVSPYFFH